METWVPKPASPLFDFEPHPNGDPPASSQVGPSSLHRGRLGLFEDWLLPGDLLQDAMLAPGLQHAVLPRSLSAKGLTFSGLMENA